MANPPPPRPRQKTHRIDDTLRALDIATERLLAIHTRLDGESDPDHRDALENDYLEAQEQCNRRKVAHDRALLAFAHTSGSAEMIQRYRDSLDSTLRVFASTSDHRRPDGGARARAPRTAGARRRQRTHVARSTSSSDPGSEDGEPEPPGDRLCDCGCGRSLAGKRADARTFDASCRQRLSRLARNATAQSPDLDRWQRALKLAADIERLERATATGRLSANIASRRAARLKAARLHLLGTRACRCGSEFAFRDPDGDAICAQCGHWRGTIAPRINGFDAFDSLLRSNGDHAPQRRVAKEWRVARGPVT